MAYRVIQIGTGGWGGTWCQRFLPPNITAGRIEVIAAADTNPEALANARAHLHLPETRCYTDLKRCLDENPAEFCTIVVPPSQHERVVDAALAHGLHILSEKPIADTLEASIRIADKVKRADRQMAVTMSHRFDQDKTTLREELRSGVYGPIDYLVCRFTCDCRQFGSWGAAFRHEMIDPLLIEGAVHHLDYLADFAAARCESIYAETWNPAWGSFGGDSQALITLRMANGVRATYEGAKTNAVSLNGWGQEYIRAECEEATLILDHRQLECFDYDPTGQNTAHREGEGRLLPLIKRGTWTNAWLIEQFCDSLDSGEPMATNVEDNLQSVAMVFGAIESSRTGKAVDVQAFLQRARERAWPG